MGLIYKRVLLALLLASVICNLLGCAFPKRSGLDENSPPISAIPNPGKAQEEEKDPIKEQINIMTMDDKLGQMLIVGLEGFTMDDNTRQMIEANHVGGFILYSSNVENPGQLVNLTNTLKLSNSTNEIPLFISVDEEGGRISRVPKELQKLPANMAIGKVDNAEFSYKIGGILADELKAFGFNLDYAPVLDINSNPKNPVIGDRAFGTEAELVSRLGVQTMKGIQEGGVIPVVKHFPGHGDTSVDSHIGLPRVESDLERLKSFELIPFENAIRNSADAVMVAHILLPKLDAENPATLSKTIITEILRKQLGFDGVVITDDMTMGAIAKNYELGSAAVRSVAAGSDVILVAHGYDNALTVLNSLKEAVESGDISEERINQSVYRILRLKQKYNLEDAETRMPDIGELNRRIVNVLDRYMK